MGIKKKEYRIGDLDEMKFQWMKKWELRKKKKLWDGVRLGIDCYYCFKEVDKSVDYYEIASGDVSHIDCLPKGLLWLVERKKQEINKNV